MPLIEKVINEEGIIYAIWHVTENEEFFARGLSLYDEEMKEISGLKERKRLEWYSSRYLLHVLSERVDRGACLRDEFGKPYLTESAYKISISHSNNYVAVIAGPRNVGIDIQMQLDKIRRIAPKFISDYEFSYLQSETSIEAIHTIWGAKETMYKAYGRKSLDFKNHIRVEPFAYSNEIFEINGRIEINDFSREYCMFGRQINNMILVYGMENEK